MNGPDHYQLAENRLAATDRLAKEGVIDQAHVMATAAQVHATLALAAAVVDAHDASPETHDGMGYTLTQYRDTWDEDLDDTTRIPVSSWAKVFARPLVDDNIDDPAAAAGS